jgi:hypothetical protein
MRENGESSLRSGARDGSLKGKGKIAPDDALVVLIENILFNQHGITNFHRE